MLMLALLSKCNDGAFSLVPRQPLARDDKPLPNSIRIRTAGTACRASSPCACVNLQLTRAEETATTERQVSTIADARYHVWPL